MVCLSTGNLPESGYSTIKHGIYSYKNGPVSTYSTLTNGTIADSGIPSALNDLARVNRVGTNVLYQYSRDNGSTWNTITTVTATGGDLYPKTWGYSTGFAAVDMKAAQTN